MMDNSLICECQNSFKNSMIDNSLAGRRALLADSTMLEVLWPKFCPAKIPSTQTVGSIARRHVAPRKFCNSSSRSALLYSSRVFALATVQKHGSNCLPACLIKFAFNALSLLSPLGLFGLCPAGGLFAFRFCAPPLGSPRAS